MARRYFPIQNGIHQIEQSTNISSVTNSRTKGRAAEQEIARHLRDSLNIDIHRNWEQQAAEGGCDLVGIPNWALEIKRAKVARLSEWWTQCCIQASRVSRRPVLIYRLDRQDWKVMISLYDLRPDLEDHAQVTLELDSWVGLVREEMNADAREFQTA